MKSKFFLLLVLLLVLPSTNIKLNVEAAQTADPVQVSPLNPNVGDVLTIQYDTSEGSISTGISKLYLQWGFLFEGNDGTPVPPAKNWYPEGSQQGFMGFYLASPMTNTSETLWEINLEIKDDLPDHIEFFFSNNPARSDEYDDNSKNYWSITPLFSTHGIYIIDPSCAETNSILKEGSLDITVRGHENATDWNVALGGRSDEPINLTISDSTFDTESGLWSLTTTLPPSVDIGLYDLIVKTTVDELLWHDTEENSVNVINAYKEDYIIALIGDQELNSYSGDDYTIDGSLHNGQNLSVVLEELSILNPDLLVNLGSATFWGDIETMQQYREYVELFYDLPHVYVASHRDRFIGNEAEWEYSGAGIGALEKIVGIRHKAWTYGDHDYFSIYTGDHRMEQSEVDWIDSEMSDATGSVQFLMIHDPIGYEDQYNPGGINAIDTAGRELLAPVLKSNGLDYYVHSSSGIDGSQQVSETGAFHIGQSGITSGYRLLKISGDVITSWGYDSNEDGLYPWNKVKVTYDTNNDGTETVQTGHINNTLAEDLSQAQILFEMASGEEYEVTAGEIYSQYTIGSTTHLKVVVPVDAETIQEVTVQPVPEETTTSSSSTETSSSSSSSSSSEVPSGSPGYEAFVAILAVIPIYLYRKKRK